jgi:hypothetical protein
VDAIETGTSAIGLDWARSGDWRILAYAGGGYARMRRLGVGWCLLHEGEEMPEEVERALCATLGIVRGEQGGQAR